MDILICDDNVMMRLQIKRYVADYFENRRLDVRITMACSGEEAVKVDRVFDLAFLDIEMRQLNGIQTGYQLKERNPNIVLFIITSYGQYLDEAFDLNVVRFLRKPLETDRLYKGLDSVLARAHPILIKTTEQQIEVEVNTIVCVYIKARKTVLLTLSGEYESSQKLDYWKQKLEGALFSQPHYSYLVNLNYVTRLEKNFILLKYGTDKTFQVFCSQRKYSEFKKDFYEMIERRG